MWCPHPIDCLFIFIFLIGCYKSIDAQYNNALFIISAANSLLMKLHEKSNLIGYYFPTVNFARNSNVLLSPYSLSNTGLYVNFYIVDYKKRVWISRLLGKMLRHVTFFTTKLMLSLKFFCLLRNDKYLNIKLNKIHICCICENLRLWVNLQIIRCTHKSSNKTNKVKVKNSR